MICQLTNLNRVPIGERNHANRLLTELVSCLPGQLDHAGGFTRTGRTHTGDQFVFPDRVHLHQMQTAGQQLNRRVPLLLERADVAQMAVDPATKVLRKTQGGKRLPHGGLFTGHMGRILPAGFGNQLLQGVPQVGK